MIYNQTIPLSHRRDRWLHDPFEFHIFLTTPHWKIGRVALRKSHYLWWDAWESILFFFKYVSVSEYFSCQLDKIYQFFLLTDVKWLIPLPSPTKCFQPGLVLCAMHTMPHFLSPKCPMPPINNGPSLTWIVLE